MVDPPRPVVNEAHIARPSQTWPAAKTRTETTPSTGTNGPSNAPNASAPTVNVAEARRGGRSARRVATPTGAMPTSHFLRVLTARRLGLPPESGGFFARAPATISVLGYDREQRVILRWNDRCHLVPPSRIWAERGDLDASTAEQSRR
jgi:hypothetical protein